jgi:hypothetical protein
MQFIVRALFTAMLFASCAKYDDKKLEGVWLLEHLNLCVLTDCLDVLEDQQTRDKFDKIELRLSRGRDAQARFYKTGILLHTFDFEFILDEKMGLISFLGPNDNDFQNFFGSNVAIVDVEKNELVYQAIEEIPNEETIYIFKRLQ